jgi:hypothetical protein
MSYIKARLRRHNFGPRISDLQPFRPSRDFQSDMSSGAIFTLIATVEVFVIDWRFSSAKMDSSGRL